MKEETKVCPMCNIEKMRAEYRLINFQGNSKKKPAKYSAAYCKPCETIYMRIWRQAWRKVMARYE